MHNLDEIDMKLLQLLVEDASLHYSEMADRVVLSPPAVSNYIERLEDIGVIRRFTIDVDRLLLEAGFPSWSAFRLATKQSDFSTHFRRMDTSNTSFSRLMAA